MPKFLVCGTVICGVSIEVDADTKEEALEIAPEIFGGVHSYCGNGSCGGKLIGVAREGETINCEAEITWNHVENA
jgi:hypothetical protein